MRLKGYQQCGAGKIPRKTVGLVQNLFMRARRKLADDSYGSFSAVRTWIGSEDSGFDVQTGELATKCRTDLLLREVGVHACARTDRIKHLIGTWPAQRTMGIVKQHIVLYRMPAIDMNCYCKQCNRQACNSLCCKLSRPDSSSH